MGNNSPCHFTELITFITTMTAAFVKVYENNINSWELWYQLQITYQFWILRCVQPKVWCSWPLFKISVVWEGGQSLVWNRSNAYSTRLIWSNTLINGLIYIQRTLNKEKINIFTVGYRFLSWKLRNQICFLNGPFKPCYRMCHTLQNIFIWVLFCQQYVHRCTLPLSCITCQLIIYAYLYGTCLTIPSHS